jgi:chemotaxis response regulator CheB
MPGMDGLETLVEIRKLYPTLPVIMFSTLTERGATAVDVLFRSAAQTYGANVLALVLTGMGADGTRGSSAIREAGGEVMVQDEASSVVWGMPGSVVAANLAHRICTLGDMGPEVVRRVSMRRAFASAGRP